MSVGALAKLLKQGVSSNKIVGNPLSSRVILKTML